MIIDNGKPVLFALNKVDLVSKKELKTKYLTKKMQSEFLRNIEQVEISALNKKGFNRVFKLAKKIIKKSQRNFTTSMLNKLLEEFITTNPPPSISVINDKCPI